jgi:uracil-DNA glycosylase family 4
MVGIMPEDFFFSSSQLRTAVRRPLSLIPKCGACGLLELCKSPKMKPTGRGKRKILIVGEAPGAEEDSIGRHFVGRDGQHLRKVAIRLGVNIDRDCILTNSIVCRPPGNESPDANRILYCRPNLVNTLDEYKPEVIIPLGPAAVRSVIGHLWKDDDVGGISKWAGFKIPVRKNNTWVCPTFHPSHLLRVNDPVMDHEFERHLSEAFALEGRPWEGNPVSLVSSIEIMHKAGEAAVVLKEFKEAGGCVAFDFETTTLKPDSKKADIVCCSVCWKGKRTVSYPWQGPAVRATLDLLWDKTIPKIGYNLKFEESWVLAKYGKGVRNWVWDGMQAAHTIDNRPGITGLKFQAFVRLGVDAYDDSVKAYFDTDREGNKENRVREVPLTTLLQYCGMDSLLEYKIGMQQMEELNMRRYWKGGRK